MEEFKAKILNFVETLSDDEPFNGDEVAELSRYFVTALCRQNGEEDQVASILVSEPAEKLLDECATIYENSRDGQSAVISHCEQLGHTTWGVCEDCECTAPYVLDPEGQKKCLICSFGNVSDVK